MDEGLFNACQEHGQLLREWYSGFRDEPSYLWDSSQSIHALWPASHKGKPYRYVGRDRAKGLYERILLESTGRGYDRRISVMGAKGSGKSYVAATVCNQIQQSRLRHVVFMDAAGCVSNLDHTLWTGLLLAFHGFEKEIAELKPIDSAAGLRKWCNAFAEVLVFVVDDWEAFEPCDDDTAQQKELKNARKKEVLQLSERHLLVEISSVNSRERLATEKSLKRKLVLEEEKYEIDGPFLPDEFATWLALSLLPVSMKSSASVDFLTGGMPRLLQSLESVRGDECDYYKLIDQPVIGALVPDFIGELKTAQDLEAAQELIFQGDLSSLLLRRIKFTCFYKVGTKYRLLSPYVQKKAVELLRVRYQSLNEGLHNQQIATWKAIVRRDMMRTSSALNSARIGWNVEGLVIDVMQIQRRVFEKAEDTSFRHVVEYAHSKEMETCDSLSGDQLVEGVLMVPMAFNEKAVDVVRVQIADGTLRLQAFQITIAKWKVRSRKKSHAVWRDVVAPKWRQSLKLQNVDFRSVEEQYFYIMPDSVGETDVRERDADEQVDNISREVIFRKLATVHSSLHEFDRFLQLVKPAFTPSKNLLKCGIEGCENYAFKEGFCCRRHLAYCKCRNADGITPCGNRVQQDDRYGSHIGARIVEDGDEQRYFKKIRDEHPEKTAAEVKEIANRTH